MNRCARIAAVVGSLISLSLAANATADRWVRDTPVSGAGTLRIDLDFGSVRVDSHRDPLTHIEAEVRGLGADAYDFELQVTSNSTGDLLTLTGRAAPWLKWLAAAPGVEVHVRVPEDFALEVVTRNGTADVSSVRAALVRTRFGAVRVQDIRGAVDIETRDGGAIEIDGVAGTVVAGSQNAAIRARFDRAPAGHFHSQGGGIEIAYPAGLGTQLSAWAPTGCVWIDNEARSGCGELIHPVSVPVNGGGSPLDLTARGGNIVLQPEEIAPF